MIVIFVSECEKAALKKTRQILDNFAERIGSTTWKTRITMEGLKTVKVLLSKYATKQTSVACHRIAGKYSTELMWIVGNKLKFNNRGACPTNYTANDNIQNYEDTWHLLQHIKIATALASLFHDFGKASKCFQNKLRAKTNQKDPLRHEWVSCVLLKAFIGNAKTDTEWLESLYNKGFLTPLDKNNNISIVKKPLEDLPPLASMIMWLILTHHKLPVAQEKDLKTHRNNTCTKKEIFAYITSGLGYDSNKSEDKTNCLNFPIGLPTTDVAWNKTLKRWTAKALEKSDEFKEIFENGLFRIVLHFSLIALKLGDHYYSSKPSKTIQKLTESSTKLYANTGFIDGQRGLRQTLSEHLNGVTENALAIAHQLPRFEAEMPTTNNIRRLKRRSPKDYDWQNKAVDEIAKWRNTLDVTNNGFFAVNMASTGCGKTIANAKIMLALSPNKNTLRYILALGLRTLTLQTGEAYRSEIGLTASDMAVLVGSKAIRELFEIEHTKEVTENEKLDFSSESAEDIFDEFIDYDCDISDEKLATVLQNEKHRNLLYAPILTCTIDHLMGATEAIRGGRGLLPNLRLMSSDLVIDEIDDFVGDDLIAISRLIFLVGMLGRKVMLSSATIQPDLALGLFNAYMNGYRLYSKSRNLASNIGCAWIDEYKTTTLNISVGDENQEENRKQYIELHKKFTANKAEKIKKAVVKRRGYIADLPETSENTEFAYFDAIKQNIIDLHDNNSEKDDKTGILTSWGIVRVANITPCADLGKYLMNTDWPSDYQVKVMVYHSQQVLLMRHTQEKYLDKLLNRKDPDTIFKEPIVRKYLAESKAKNMIFIVVSTPVEEIGRDHDFNWAVIEPSSFRSIIQLAGRVRRHRQEKPENENIAVLRYNFKGYKNKNSSIDEKVFVRPGYENISKLNSHDLNAIIDENLIKEGINSIPRIIAPDSLNEKNSLIDLEHYSARLSLGNFINKGPQTPLGWISEAWWLTSFSQILAPFRKGQKSEILYLLPKFPGNENTLFTFCLKDADKYEPYEIVFGITNKEPEIKKESIWLDRNYYKLLEEYSENGYVDKSAKRYGFIEVVKYNDNDKFEYSHILGLLRK